MLDIEKVILLKSCSIFADTPDRALASVASIIEGVEVSAGQTIIRKGEVESCMYLVVKGSVRVHDGRNTIALLGEGEIIGEMALLDPAPRSASVTAEENTLLFRLEKDAFDVAMADNPDIVHGVIHVICQRLRRRIQEQDSVRS